jgi:hypothetical protein
MLIINLLQNNFFLNFFKIKIKPYIYLCFFSSWVKKIQSIFTSKKRNLELNLLCLFLILKQIGKK